MLEDIENSLMITETVETQTVNSTTEKSGDTWAETATSILFSVLLFLAIYLTAKLYGLVKGKSKCTPRFDRDVQNRVQRTTVCPSFYETRTWIDSGVRRPSIEFTLLVKENLTFPAFPLFPDVFYYRKIRFDRRTIFRIFTIEEKKEIF